VIAIPLAAQLGTLPQSQLDPNPSGSGQTWNVNGATAVANSPFFQAFGTNNRTCASCHQPANGMSISAASVQARYVASAAQDPLFAPVDGANCPDAVKPGPPVPVNAPNNPRSLLLNRALIRVGLPWPPANVKPEFSISIAADPTSCELDPVYGINSKTPTVSVYRRALMAANLKYVTTVGPGVTPPGVTLPIDPNTGLPESGNIMFDGREPTLQHQAADAILTHEQGTTLPSPSIIQQIVNFENGIYSAQAIDNQAQSVTALGAMGGPQFLSSAPAGVLAAPNTFSIYSAWTNLPPADADAPQRESVARGEAIFNTRPFTISNVAGINDVLGNNIIGNCTTCHNNTSAGNDAKPQAQIEEGTTGGAAALPAPDLPLFKLTCVAGKTTPFNGSTVLVRDPGKALITGKCADIGKVKSSQLRALAARAPYFHDGSAPGLQDVVNFYNRRFNIKFTPQEMQDLVNFLKTL
jgi:mono/diheme cytochrome c family protein